MRLAASGAPVTNRCPGRARNRAISFALADAATEPRAGTALAADARITRIYEGTSEMQRLIISRALLGKVAA